MELLRHLLFENPWTLWILLGLAALAAGVIWGRTGSRRAARAACAFVAAGVLVGVLDWAVETERERLMRTLDTLDHAASTGNADLFMERVSAEYRSGSFSKERLAAAVRHGLKEVRASAESPVIEQGENEATVTQACRLSPAPGAQFAIPPQFQRITWEGRFAREADGEWRLRSAVAVSPQRMTPEEAVRFLPR
jgi:hypothetical protein